MLNSTQVVVVFSGGIGTEAEIDVAIKQNCNIIPVITCKEDRENPAIKILNYSDNMKNIEIKDATYYNKIVDEDGVVTMEEIYMHIKNNELKHDIIKLKKKWIY